MDTVHALPFTKQIKYDKANARVENENRDACAVRVSGRLLYKTVLQTLTAKCKKRLRTAKKYVELLSIDRALYELYLAARRPHPLQSHKINVLCVQSVMCKLV